MMPPGTPTEWRAPQRTIDTERTQGTAHTTREEGTIVSKHFSYYGHCDL